MPHKVKLYRYSNIAAAEAEAMAVGHIQASLPLPPSTEDVSTGRPTLQMQSRAPTEKMGLAVRARFHFHFHFVASLGRQRERERERERQKKREGGGKKKARELFA